MTLSMEMTHVFEVPLDADDKQIVKLKRVETGTITLVADDGGYDMVFELPFTSKLSYPQDNRGTESNRTRIRWIRPVKCGHG